MVRREGVARATHGMSSEGGVAGAADRVCVTFWDGSSHQITARPHETVASLKHRLAGRTGVPASSLQMSSGESEQQLLTDATTVASCPSATLTAWTTVRAPVLVSVCLCSPWPPHCAPFAQRHSRRRSEEALVRAQHSAALHSAPVLMHAAKASTAALVTRLRDVDIWTWAKLAVWFVVFRTACRGDLGVPFLVATATYLFWRFGFSERGEGEESAYTVFNGMRALPGQLRAEELQRQMHGM